jgi:signal transduction histidine kinase
MDAHPQAEVESGSREGLATRELIERMAWIGRLRWVAAAGVAAAVTITRWGFGVPLPPAPLYALAAGLAAYNGLLWAIGKRLPRSAPAAAAAVANLQLSIDLLFLAGLLYFAGGIENPFIFYFVFHIVIASILLSRRATYGHTAVACLLVIAMAAARATGRAPHHHLYGVVPEQVHFLPAFVYGAAFAVTSTLVLTAYFATSITARLRRREAQVLSLSRSLEHKAADLSRANEQLRRSESAKADYMRRVAHELRSPLATVEQMVTLVAERRKGEITAATEQTLARVRVRLRRLMEVARDLLALSRAREADLSQQMRQVRLAEVVTALAPDLTSRAQQAGVALEINVPAALPAVAGDPESLAQLVVNLATNALKYTPAGGWVKLAARADGDQVELTVADSGIGIPPAEVGQIFNEFYRASNARESSEEGTGLGLSIVNAICYAHRAEITVESEPGRGATFRVRFPAGGAGEAEEASSP